MRTRNCRDWAIAFVCILALVLLSGCTTVPKYEPDVRQNFATLPSIEPLALKPVVPAPKPEPVFTDTEAKLDVTQMKKLYTLVVQNKEVVQERNDLLALSNRLIADRNKLLNAARQEETRANTLSLELADERDRRAAEQRWATVERVTFGAIGTVLLLAL